MNRKCSLCQREITDECDSPMLNNEIWERVSNEHFDEYGHWVSQFICLECMEAKLGREICEDDLLILDGNPRHVLWNIKFVNEHFPQHKYPFDDLLLHKAVNPEDHR